MPQFLQACFHFNMEFMTTLPRHWCKNSHAGRSMKKKMDTAPQLLFHRLWLIRNQGYKEGFDFYEDKLILKTNQQILLWI